MSSLSSGLRCRSDHDNMGHVPISFFFPLIQFNYSKRDRFKGAASSQLTVLYVLHFFRSLFPAKTAGSLRLCTAWSLTCWRAREGDIIHEWIQPHVHLGFMKTLILIFAFDWEIRLAATNANLINSCMDSVILLVGELIYILGGQLLAIFLHSLCLPLQK